MVNSLNVAVLFGGASSERDVSLRSGTAVVKALMRRGHRVTPVDVKTETGAELDGLRCDVAFLALHGGFGEDGGIQRLLDQRGVPYTGSGPAASRAAMDKIESKRIFSVRGIETPAHRVISRSDEPDLLEKAALGLGYPLVVKPAREGSSVGVTIHRDPSTLHPGCSEAFKYGPHALMEKFAAGRELTVGVLDERTLPIIEVRPAEGFFDYSAKYKDTRTQYVVNPNVADADAKVVRDAAVRAYRALGCDGAARVDIILTAQHAASVLEVNTLPGMTERSLLPKAAWAAGMEYGELCEKMCFLGIRRKRGASWVAML